MASGQSSGSLGPGTGWVDYIVQHNPGPANPVHGDTVHLNTTVDSAKVREVPFVKACEVRRTGHGHPTVDTAVYRYT